MAKISIIIPVYNTALFLNRCISSVLAQKYESYEVILVDDGSTDQSPLMCDEFVKSYDNFQVIHQENRGLLLARRTGISIAKGKYIIHLDSDDELAEECLETLKSYIDKFKSQLLIFNYVHIDNDNHILNYGKSICNDEYLILTNKEFIKYNLKDYRLNVLWSKCAEHSIVDCDTDYTKYGRINMGEDLLQSAALLENASQILYINRPLYRYRFNRNSISNKFNYTYIYDFLKVRRRILSLLKKCEADKEAFELFYRNYLHDLNSYLLRVMVLFKAKEEFGLLREKIAKEEICLNQAIKYSSTEKMIYYICKSKFYSLLYPVAFFYFKCKKN